jgi:hypothetical protein
MPADVVKVSTDTAIAIVFGVVGTLLAIGALVVGWKQLKAMKKETRKSTSHFEDF